MVSELGLSTVEFRYMPRLSTRICKKYLKFDICWHYSESVV